MGSVVGVAGSDVAGLEEGEFVEGGFTEVLEPGAPGFEPVDVLELSERVGPVG